MKSERQEARFGNPEKLVMQDEAGEVSFKEQVIKARVWAKERLETEEELLKFISTQSKNIPDEEECGKLAERPEWVKHRIVEGPMVRAMIEVYTQMRRG